MIRKMISLSLFAVVVCLGANGFVSADCTTCANGGCAAGAGCASGNCGGNCLGNLLGNLNHDSHGSVGPCMTCNNIWDDYCATKDHCLPQAKYPFQHKGGGGCGACSSCNAGVGVGLYGNCGSGSCGTKACGAAPCAAPAACDAPCASGKFASGGLLGKLFQHKHKHKRAGCAEAGCADCASGGVAINAAPVSSQPAYSPSDVPAQMPTENAAPEPPVPPAPPAPAAAPSVADQTSRSGAFDWLQQALQK